MKIAIIGTGNVAWHLAAGLHSFFDITVMGRNIEALNAFAKRYDVQVLSPLQRIDADLFILAVKDTAIGEVAGFFRGKPMVHTAGGIGMDVLSFFSERYGVIYPFQTFRKEYEIDWQKVPVFIEACCPGFEQTLETIARKLTGKVYFLPGSKRQYLHLAGVLVNNFVNHLIARTRDLLEAQGLEYEYVLPLLEKTAENAHRFDPREIQTGPAVRGDWPTIERHLSLIDDPQLRSIYEVLSQSIQNYYSKAKNT